MDKLSIVRFETSHQLTLSSTAAMSLSAHLIRP